MLQESMLQDGRVEFWAAALPHQAAQEGYPRVPRRSPEDILLGHGTFGLQDLLTKAQVRLSICSMNSVLSRPKVSSALLW